MKLFIQRAALVAVLGSGVAACGGSGSDATAPPPPPPPVVVHQEDQFGTAFGVDFRASPMSNPVTPAPGDIVPLSLTTNPVNVG